MDGLDYFYADNRRACATTVTLFATGAETGRPESIRAKLGLRAPQRARGGRSGVSVRWPRGHSMRARLYRCRKRGRRAAALAFGRSWVLFGRSFAAGHLHLCGRVTVAFGLDL